MKKREDERKSGYHVNSETSKSVENIKEVMTGASRLAVAGADRTVATQFQVRLPPHLFSHVDVRSTSARI